MNATGTQLRELRQRIGLSQSKLAQLSGISQHLLSAFELEKAALPESLLDVLSQSLANNEKVTAIANRRKRYREHQYDDVELCPNRVARAVVTSGNAQYRRVLDDIAERHLSQKHRDWSALSLFSGCGGFSLGFSAAGFVMKGFVELVPELRNIYQHNFQSSVELGADITKVEEATLKNLVTRLGEIDVIIGGPPCQGFSLAGKRKTDDPRNTLFKHYLRFVDCVRPKFAVLENVRLLTSMKNVRGELVKDDICEEFRSHGYRMECFEVNARDYGVPQHRERVLFVAVRADLDLSPSIPQPTHSVSRDLFSETSRFRTFADACSDLSFLESGGQSDDELHQAVTHPAHVIEWLWDVPEGASAHENEDATKRPPSGYNTTYKRQVWNEPAGTVQTTFGMISGCRNVHPIATRSLTIREAARIQSFPDSFRFVGGLGTIRTGIGNAVPPLLAFAVGQHVRQLLSNLVEIPRS